MRRIYLQLFFLILMLCFGTACQDELLKTCSQDMLDERDGQTYCTVTIGTQLWMAENLRFVSDSSYLNPSNPSTVNQEYGRLYTFSQALNVCPEGWHLPSDDEWKQLESFAGLNANELDLSTQRGNTAGAQLKATEGWASSNDSNAIATDLLGFKALPAGEWNPSFGPYFNLGTEASFWTSTAYDSTGGAWMRRLSHSSGSIERNYFSQSFGFSCRCIKN